MTKEEPPHKASPDLASFIDGIRDRVIPTADEAAEIHRRADLLSGELAKAIVEVAASDLVPSELKEAFAGLEPLQVGSVAKGTFLKDPDLDVFIPFPKEVPARELKRLGLAIARKVIPEGEEKYAQHPYLHGMFQGSEVDLVPCYKLANIEAMATAVDRTPFHTAFIKKNIKEGQADEVRLFKRFLKGIEAYGANDEVRGFSGYLSELMVLRFGTFRGVLEASLKWKADRAVLLVLGDEGREREGRDLDWREGRGDDCSPLFFLDPTDLDRNVASALNMDRFSIFLVAAREFMASPRAEYFFPAPFEPMDPGELARILGERGSEAVVVALDVEAIAEDKLLSQVRKAVKAVEAPAVKADFGLLGSGYHYFMGEGGLWRVEMLFEFDGRLLPAVKKHAGPPLGHANCGSFLDRWRNDPAASGRPYIEDGRWMVDVVRSEREPGPFIRARLDEVNLGKHLNEARERGAVVLRIGVGGGEASGTDMGVEGGEASGTDGGAEGGAGGDGDGVPTEGPRGHLTLLSRYLDRRRSWER